MTTALGDKFRWIYRNNVWGTPETSAIQFYSGSGAHDENIAGPYVAAMHTFLRYFELLEGRKAARPTRSTSDAATSPSDPGSGPTAGATPPVTLSRT